MPKGRFARLLPLAIATVPFTSAAHGQVEAKSPVHVTVNGVFLICPTLVGSGGSFPEAELQKLGFALASEPGSKSPRFEALGDMGMMTVEYEADTKTSILNYGGGGYKATAGVVRDVATDNGFKRITGGDRDGAKADVFEGRTPDGKKSARMIVIENYTQNTASVSYSEK